MQQLHILLGYSLSVEWCVGCCGGDGANSTGLQASDPSEKERNLAALAYARDPDLRQQTLEMVLDDSVRSQDALSLLAGVAVRSNDAAHAAWSFLTE